tara:strand:- start:423 stop:1139 length:717 start_codon:yes stop_codon:yes gene_type:complete
MKNLKRNFVNSIETVLEKESQESSIAEVKKKPKKDLNSSKDTSRKSLKTMKESLNGNAPSSEKQKSTSIDAQPTKAETFQTPTRRREGSRKVAKEKAIQKILFTEDGINDVLDGLRSGATLQTVSRALSIPYKDLKVRMYHKDLKDRTQAAIKDGADAIVEKSQELLTRLLPDDEVDINPNKAKIVLEHYRWLAKVKNPAKYSEHQIHHVETRDLTAEHLEELRRINADRNKAKNTNV